MWCVIVFLGSQFWWFLITQCCFIRLADKSILRHRNQCQTWVWRVIRIEYARNGCSISKVIKKLCFGKTWPNMWALSGIEPRSPPPPNSLPALNKDVITARLRPQGRCSPSGWYGFCKKNGIQIISWELSTPKTSANEIVYSELMCSKAN